MMIEVRHQGRVGIVRLIGPSQAGDEADLAAAVGSLLEGQGTRLVIDLSGLPFINSSVLGALVRVTAQANIQESRIILAAPSEFVRGLLQTTHLDRFFEVAASVADAVATLAPA